MISAVLDSSALLAVLYREPGGEAVAARLREAAITTVNLAEVATVLARGSATALAVERILGPLPVAIIDFDQELAYASAMLAPLTKPAGLSLGDRSCLALARRLDVPALTADRNWEKVAQTVGAAVELIR